MLSSTGTQGVPDEEEEVAPPVPEEAEVVVALPVLPVLPVVAVAPPVPPAPPIEDEELVDEEVSGAPPLPPAPPGPSFGMPVLEQPSELARRPKNTKATLDARFMYISDRQQVRVTRPRAWMSRISHTGYARPSGRQIPK